MGKKLNQKLVCIDVGNSSSSYALYEGKRLKGFGHYSSNKIPGIVMKLLSKVDNIPNYDIIVSSVVPQITLKLRKVIGKKRGARLWVIGRDIKVRIKHKYFNINKLGSDRLVNAYGAMRIYAPPLLILDYGTALTCDYISEKGVFMGGLIIPGPEVSLEALCKRAALLPQITFPRAYNRLWGRDTLGGMKAGILQGYAAMTDGLIERFRRRFGRRFQVVAAGGFAKVIYPYTRHIDILDPLLTLKSLARIFRDRV
jgi:type III pantothenate kinase